MNPIRRPWPLGVLVLALLLAAVPRPARAEEEALFNETMIQDPGKGEAPSKGEFLVFHEGEGETPKQGYFKQHEPGEVAEYHLFVPEKLAPGKRYPLLIAYHGGKDGGSGKGLCRTMARLSTKEHPVLVLSPNMYTLDAYHEMLKDERWPVDPRRVVVFGFSSGGMGVRAAMAEFVRTRGAFVPATLVAASTTASVGRNAYPPVPYVVMAGEKETPEFARHPLLKTRRSTCRKHALMMQQVIREVRYLEMRGHGHAAGKDDHRAVLRNLIRALPETAVDLKAPKGPGPLKALGEAARAGRWAFVQEEMARLDEDPTWAGKIAWKTLRKRILAALETWYASRVRFLKGLGAKAQTWARLRAFATYDRLRSVAILFEDTPAEEPLYAQLDSLEKAAHWQRELKARQAYLEIVKAPPSAEMGAKLQALRAAMGDTEYGGNRTREKLLALRG